MSRDYSTGDPLSPTPRGGVGEVRATPMISARGPPGSGVALKNRKRCSAAARPSVPHSLTVICSGAISLYNSGNGALREMVMIRVPGGWIRW